MTPSEQRLHKRLRKLKGRLFNLIGKIESMQLILSSENHSFENTEQQL